MGERLIHECPQFIHGHGLSAAKYATDKAGSLRQQQEDGCQVAKEAGRRVGILRQQQEDGRPASEGSRKKEEELLFFTNC